MERTRKFTDVIGVISPEERVDIDAAKAEMRAEQVSYQLGELRKKRGITQAKLAERIGKSQAAVSAMESSNDTKISTLAAAVEAMDGHLEVVAVFDEERVQLA